MYVTSILPQERCDLPKPAMKGGKSKPLLTCDVCSEKGSGVKGHYDRKLCNGCRAFVKRVVKKTIIVALCTGDMQCSVKCYDRYRIKCRECRFMQCCSVGVNFKKVEAFKDLTPLEQEGLLVGILPRRMSSDEAKPKPASRPPSDHVDKENIRRNHAHLYFSTGRMVNTPNDLSTGQFVNLPSDLSTGQTVNCTPKNFSTGHAVKTEPGYPHLDASAYLQTNTRPEPVQLTSYQSALLNYNMFGTGPPLSSSSSFSALNQTTGANVPTTTFSFNRALLGADPVVSYTYPLAEQQQQQQLWRHDNSVPRHPLSGPFIGTNQIISQNGNDNELAISYKLSPVISPPTAHSSNQNSYSGVHTELTIHRSNIIQGQTGEGHSALVESHNEPMDLTNKSYVETKARHFNSTTSSRRRGFQPPTTQNKAVHNNFEIVTQSHRTPTIYPSPYSTLPGYTTLPGYNSFLPSHLTPIPQNAATIVPATSQNDCRSPTFINNVGANLTNVYSNFLTSQQMMYNQMLSPTNGHALPPGPNPNPNPHAAGHPYSSYTPVFDERGLFVNHNRNSNAVSGFLTKPYSPDHEPNDRRQGHERSGQVHHVVTSVDPSLRITNLPLKRPRDRDQGRYSASPNSSNSDTDQDIPAKLLKGCSAETSVVSLEGNDSGIDATFSFISSSSSSLSMSDTIDGPPSDDSASLSPDTTIQLFITDKPTLKRGTGFMVRDLFTEAESNSENLED